MTQTVNAINTVNAVIHLSNDGVTWKDFSGSTNKVDVPPQTADSGEAATLDGKYKISTEGKLNPIELTFTIFYTENALEAYEFIRSQAALAARSMWARFAPIGTSNTYRFTTANGAEVASAAKITEYPAAPPIDAGDAKPTMIQFKLRCETLVRTLVTPSASLSPSASASPSASLSPSASPSAGG